MTSGSALRLRFTEHVLSEAEGLRMLPLCFISLSPSTLLWIFVSVEVKDHSNYVLICALITLTYYLKPIKRPERRAEPELYVKWNRFSQRRDPQSKGVFRLHSTEPALSEAQAEVEGW